MGNVFAYELGMLHRGAPVGDVARKAFGNCLEGVRWQHMAWYVITHGELATGQLATTPLRHSYDTERLTLTLLLEALGRIERKTDTINGKTRKRLVAQSADLYLGKLSARLGISVTALQNRLRVFRLPVPQGGRNGGDQPLLTSWEKPTKRGPRRTSQPRPQSPDALMPRDGDFSYLEFEPATMLPASVMRRLRLRMGEIQEKDPAAADAATEAPKPVPESAGYPPRAGAPPNIRWAEADDPAAACADLARQLREHTPSWQKKPS